MQNLKMDIATLKEYALFLVEIIINAYPKSQKNEILFFRKYNGNLIEKIYSRGRVSGFKVIISDLELQVKLLDVRLIAIANSEIKERFGFTISQEKELKKTERILNRGHIKTEQEYRFLNNFYEWMSVEESKNHFYLKKISKMLDKYSIG